jgi:hypothetical protein
VGNGKSKKTEVRLLSAFFTSAEINNRKVKFNYDVNYDEYETIFNRPLQKLSIPNILNGCAVNGCDETKVEMHHVRKLERRLQGFIVKSIKGKSNKLIKGMHMIESALRRKQIPLCPAHHLAFHNGDITLFDVDFTFANQNIKLLGKNRAEFNFKNLK